MIADQCLRDLLFVLNLTAQVILLIDYTALLVIYINPVPDPVQNSIVHTGSTEKSTCTTAVIHYSNEQYVSVCVSQVSTF